MCENQESVLAPCQCLPPPAGVKTTVPGSRNTTSLPSSWCQARNAVARYPGTTRTTFKSSWANLHLEHALSNKLMSSLSHQIPRFRMLTHHRQNTLMHLRKTHLPIKHQPYCRPRPS